MLIGAAATGAIRARLVELTYVDVDHLDAAVASVGEIQAVAQADRDLVIEGCALVHASWSHLLRGELPTAAFCLDRADDVFAEVPGVVAADLWEWPLLHACRGVLAAWRGEGDAGAHFDRADEVSAATGSVAGDAVGRALRAESLPRRDPRPAPDAPAAQGLSWTRVWARRGRAAAALAAGDLDEADRLIDALLADDDDLDVNVIERGRTLLLHGEVQLRREDPRALTTLRAAAELLEPRGARYPATRALVLLAEAAATPAEAAAALGRARALSTSDPGFTTLWRLRPLLRVDVLGQQAVRLGDQHLALSRNAAQLVHLLALAGPHGRHWETVADHLWPHVVDAGRAASNLTSLTRNARARLGAEAWRLRREGPMLYFDLDHAGLDLADAVATAEWCLGVEPPRDPERLADALVRLRRPVLPRWADTAWVQETDAWRAERLASLTSLLASHAAWTAPGRPAPRM